MVNRLSTLRPLMTGAHDLHAPLSRRSYPSESPYDETAPPAPVLESTTTSVPRDPPSTTGAGSAESADSVAAVSLVAGIVSSVTSPPPDDTTSKGPKMPAPATSPVHMVHPSPRTISSVSGPSDAGSSGSGISVPIDVLRRRVEAAVRVHEVLGERQLGRRGGQGDAGIEHRHPHAVVGVHDRRQHRVVVAVDLRLGDRPLMAKVSATIDRRSPSPSTV